MTYVTRIETNVKSPRGVAYDLAPCTLITGDNASGKSALVDAISLALTGESRSEGLRRDARLLLRLAPPGPPGTTSRELYSRAHLSDGTETSFRVAGSQPEWVPGTTLGVFLADVARALLYGDAKTLVQAIAASSHAVIFRDELESEVTKNVLPLFNDIWTKDCGLDSSPSLGVTDVQRVLGAVKERIKTARAIVKSTKSNEALILPLSEEDQDELQLATAVLAVLRHGQTIEELLRDMGDLPPYDPAEHERLLDRQAIIEHAVRSLDLLEKHAPQGHFSCPLCSRRGMTRRTVSRRREVLRPMASTADASVDEQSALQHRHELHRAARAFVDRGMSTGDVQARRADLLRRHEANAAQPTRNAVRTVTEEELTQLDLIQAVCTEAIRHATDKQLGTVERRINQALPPRYRAKLVSEGGYRLELSTPKNELLRDFRALSGTERTLLLSAFSAATIPEGAPPVRIVVVDDVWLGTRQLRNMLQNLRNVVGRENGPTQALVCAVAFRGKAVDGWCEVKLGSQDDGGDDV